MIKWHYSSFQIKRRYWTSEAIFAKANKIEAHSQYIYILNMEP